VQFGLRIAVKPYIKKFIANDYQVDPFILTTNNLYGIFLFNSLEKPSPRVLKKIDEEDDLDPAIYSETLEVLFSEKYWEVNGCLITQHRQYLFNKFASYVFHDEFYKYVKNRIGPKGSINRAIFNFRDIYSISEDELSFKTIQRAFQRRNAYVNASKSA
jgi:hypothetical protein